MSTQTKYRLSEDVVIFPVQELNEKVRDKIDSEAPQFAVTKKGSRYRSKVIDDDCVQLLKQFSKESSIVNAVKSFSLKAGQEAQDVLSASYDFIKEMVECGFLLDSSTDKASATKTVLDLGQAIEDYRLIGCLQVLEDTEVYKLQNDAGDLAVLKLIKTPAKDKVIKGLKREVEILKRLEGNYAPRYISQGKIKDCPYLIMTWFEGSPLVSYFELIRNMGQNDRQKELKKVIFNITKAYAYLHDQGIIHSDIHPGNILIGRTGEVCLLDFSFSRFDDLDQTCGTPPRFCISFFKDPNLAKASLADTKRPKATALDEQYALGALLYFIITGAHYIDFSIEREKQLQEIIEQKPRTFSEVIDFSFPQLEAIILRMLSKGPKERFSSMEECSAMISHLAAVPHSSSAPEPLNSKDYPLLHTVQSLEHLNTKIPAPTASVNYGAAGIAYALYSKALINNCAETLAFADAWAMKATSELNKKEALINEAMDIKNEVVSNGSIYHSELGLYLVQALISDAMGDVVSRDAAIESYVKAGAGLSQATNLDFTLGTSGTLLGCALLYKIGAKRKDLFVLGEDLGQRIKEELCATESILRHRRIKFVGLAHGFAGMFYALFCWQEATNAQNDELLLARLEELSSLAYHSKIGVCWPHKLSRRSITAVDCDNPSWCNGSAGHVYLWAKAYDLYKRQDFFDLAAASAMHAYNHTDKITNLCCGLAGRALAQVRMYQLSNDKTWLNYYSHLCDNAYQAKENSNFYDASLIKGRLGIELASAFKHDIRQGHFPLMLEDNLVPI